MSSWYQAAQQKALETEQQERAAVLVALRESMEGEVAEEESMLAAIDAQVEADASRVEP